MQIITKGILMVKRILICLFFLGGFMVYASSPVKEALDDLGLSDYELVDCVKTIADCDIVSAQVEVNYDYAVHNIGSLEIEFNNAFSVEYAEIKSPQLEYPVGFIRTYRHGEKTAIVKKNTARNGFRRFYYLE